MPAVKRKERGLQGKREAKEGFLLPDCGAGRKEGTQKANSYER